MKPDDTTGITTLTQQNAKSASGMQSDTTHVSRAVLYMKAECGSKSFEEICDRGDEDESHPRAE